MWILSFWIFPVVSACMWLATLMTMIIHWSVTGSPHYPTMEAGQHIAYISDVGASSLKPLFITGSVVTTVFLDLAFLSERWLRHTGQLARNTSATQTVLSICSILFALVGTCGLILLSIFDNYHHPQLHDWFLAVFIAGYVISAIFACAEYQRLGIHYRNHRVLRISFWLKLAFIFVEVTFAIVFISTSHAHHRNVAAVFEWIVAFVFTFYLLSYIVDLLPSVRTKHHIPQGLKDQMIESGTLSPSLASAGKLEYQEPWTTDSTGPNSQNAAGGPRLTPETRHSLTRIFDKFHL